MKLTPLILCLCLLLLAGCGQKTSWRKGGTPGTSPYTVLGKTYYPLKSAAGYVEEGIASWYGPGFHGKSTASGEKYNQHDLTAAHKILPLGTQVRVTHLGNGRSIVVRVNDRGPFVADRVIDLSKAAATQLQMTGTGTARVRVQSMDTQQGAEATDNGKDYYVQVGAFSTRESAMLLAGELSKAGMRGHILHGKNGLWILQIGPWPDTASAGGSLREVLKRFPQAFVTGENRPAAEQ